MGDEKEVSDLELVARVNRGEWGAFDLIYFRYRDWAYRLAWRFCGDADDAQDAVQEVFVYLAGKFRVGPGLELRAGMTTLLYPAVKHTALGIKKKRRRMGALPEDDMVTRGQSDKGSGVGAGMRREELRGVLAGLSEDHREVLLMRFVDDMSLEEIALALGIPLGTAKSRLHHAVKGVREDAGVRRYFSEGT